MDNSLKTNVLKEFARTKIVATIGPASNSPEVLKELILAGADVFRLNMAHGTREDHEKAINNIRAVSDEMEIPVGILVDLAGPKIRLGQLFQDPLQLTNGDVVKFVRGTQSKAADELTCLFEPLVDEVSVGDTVVLADGIARMEVTEKTTTCSLASSATVARFVRDRESTFLQRN